MSWRLVVEVLYCAPADLTPAERLVLVVLAEQTRNETTRLCSPGMDVICQGTGLQPDSVRRAFQRLAARGLEVRVAVGKDKNGRAVYAHEGARTTYRVPSFALADAAAPRPDGAGTTVPPQEETTDPAPEDGGGTTVPPQGSGGAKVPPERRDENPKEAGPQSFSGGTTVPPSPYRKYPSPPAAVGDATDGLFPPPADAAQPRGRVKRAKPSKSAEDETHNKLAVDLTRQWWESQTPKPSGRFVGYQQIVYALLLAGHAPDAIAEALRRCGFSVTRASAEFQLKKLVEEFGANDQRPLGGAPKPPWCGACNENSRLIDDGAGPYRCPRCHPLTQKADTP